MSASMPVANAHRPLGARTAPFIPDGMPPTRFGTPVLHEDGYEDYSLDWPAIVTYEPRTVVEWFRFLCRRRRRELMLILHALYDSFAAAEASAELHPGWVAFVDTDLPCLLLELASDASMYGPNGVPGAEAHKVWHYCQLVRSENHLSLV